MQCQSNLLDLIPANTYLKKTITSSKKVAHKHAGKMRVQNAPQYKGNVKS